MLNYGQFHLEQQFDWLKKKVEECTCGNRFLDYVAFLRYFVILLGKLRMCKSIKPKRNVGF